MREYKEPSHRNMTISQVINKLSGIVDSAEYCEIEGILCRAIVMLKDYKDLLMNILIDNYRKGQVNYEFCKRIIFT